jgi:cobalt transporter subunit CbtA
MDIKTLTGALIGGCVTGIVAGALHFGFLQDIILQAELYESRDLIHFGQPDTAATGAGAEAHGHSDGGDAPEVTRNLLTMLFAGLIYAGYGLILAAIFQFVRARGHNVTAMQGVLWGLAGFAVVQMAPSMGLAPNLPGTISEDINLRQYWWFGTMAATAIGLGLMFLRPSALTIAVGFVLIALPHVIGAPVLDEFYGVAPPELSATFATRVIGVAFFSWALLGALVARLTDPNT